METETDLAPPQQQAPPTNGDHRVFSGREQFHLRRDGKVIGHLWLELAECMAAVEDAKRAAQSEPGGVLPYYDWLRKLHAQFNEMYREQLARVPGGLTLGEVEDLIQAVEVADLAKKKARLDSMPRLRP
jgi:hypothetical protein